MSTGLRGADLAYATLDYIREHPEEWGQDMFFCGTQACFAGTAIMVGTGTDRLSAEVLAGRKPGEYAQRLLGWTDAGAEYVFGLMTRQFRDLEEAVKKVLNGDSLPEASDHWRQVLAGGPPGSSRAGLAASPGSHVTLRAGSWGRAQGIPAPARHPLTGSGEIR